MFSGTVDFPVVENLSFFKFGEHIFEHFDRSARLEREWLLDVAVVHTAAKPSTRLLRVRQHASTRRRRHRQDGLGDLGHRLSNYVLAFVSRALLSDLVEVFDGVETLQVISTASAVSAFQRQDALPFLSESVLNASPRSCCTHFCLSLQPPGGKGQSY